MNQYLPVEGAPPYREHISRRALERWLSVRGEGDEWDFKATLGQLSEVGARVNLAKDALALCNLATGGTLIVGVTSSYDHVGLSARERIDTTAIRHAIEKYIDGDFEILAAEYEIADGDDDDHKRYGIVHFGRRGTQPVLAAKDGQIRNDQTPLFRSGDILIRRGAASVRANSGDVRRFFTNSMVHEEQIRAVNALWYSIVEQRKLLGGCEYLYDLLVETEYHEVPLKESLRLSLGNLSQYEHADRVGQLQHRVALVRPHLSSRLFDQYRACSALMGRLLFKAIVQRDSKAFLPWTLVDGGGDDSHLRGIALTLMPESEVDRYWAGRATDLGIHRPLKPLIDAAEREIIETLRSLLSGKSDLYWPDRA